ncbi:MAG: hypothetical protein HBSAPP03_17420 [Phycisphaerae bacterium]|nr:MAG: hypothetical protein HBSAPP03_17420 [Phycisphaerae bacterium]
MLAGRSPPPPRTLEDLLPPELAARLDRLDLLSRKILAGKLPGERRSKRRGQSVEFDDFRDYTPGDDPRHIDWNAYARLDRLLIKIFRAEEDLALHLLVDASASMNVGDPNKAVYAHRLAMALAYVGLVNQNRVCMGTFGGAGGVSERLAPLRGRTGIQRIARFLLDSLARLNRATPTGPDAGDLFADVMRRMMRLGSPRGIVVVVSDFLFDAEAGLNALTPGVATGMIDPFAVQVLAPGELDPARDAPLGLIGDLRLTDVETGRAAEVTITPDAVERYRAGLAAHHARLRHACHARGVAHVLVPTDTPVEVLVTNTLRRGGMLR